MSWSILGLVASIFTQRALALPQLLDVGDLAGSDSTVSPLEERTFCTNLPLTRSCWSTGYTVDTDFDQSWPNTGTVRTYAWTITNGTCNPDGHSSRTCLMVNNQFPGPLLTGNWGDTFKITVTNAMQNNGTSIHWHGLRQFGSVGMDGIGGITECAIAPGFTKTYTFQATQYGTTWYHSHHSVQYGDGLLGPVVINGPSTENYDIDGGPVMVQDWYYKSAYQNNLVSTSSLQLAQPPPIGDTILINGKNKNSAGTGSYTTISLTSLLRTKLRIINTSVDNALRVSIDGHSFDVVTADFVPVTPITVTDVLLAPGQRYEIVVTANQFPGNYWMRATVEGACGSANNGVGLAIVNYVGWPLLTPTTTSKVVSNGCAPPGALVPRVPNVVGNSSAFIASARDVEVNLLIPGVTTHTGNIVTWGVNASAIHVAWDKPTLQYVFDGNTSYPSTENIINIGPQGVWTYWIIQETGGANTPVPLPHPMHLHGHDFYILGTGSGIFDMVNDPPTLSYNNPTRRDTMWLPGGGWLALAFPSDNPGAWLFHCHIAWHISGGLGVQFLYPPSTIPLPDATQFGQQCAAWKTYDATSVYKEDDSGL